MNSFKMLNTKNGSIAVGDPEMTESVKCAPGPFLPSVGPLIAERIA